MTTKSVPFHTLNPKKNKKVPNAVDNESIRNKYGMVFFAN